jgi:phosphate transport system substrate-binding protein
LSVVRRDDDTHDGQDVLMSDKMPRHKATALAAIALVLPLLVGCGAAAPTPPTPEPLSGTYAASGGGGALAAVQALTARFKELHPGVNWIVTESGSSAAVKLAAANTIDIGFVSRALTDAEKELQVNAIAIGFSGTALVVNAANPATNLTKEQLRQIYTGAVLNWSQLGGVDQEIRPYVRERAAATRQNLEGYIFAGSVPMYGKNVVEQVEVEAMLTAVKSFRGAIGIATAGSRTNSDTRVKVIKIDGVAPTQESISNGTYKIVRPLAVVYSNAAEQKPAIRAFVEFVKSAEGQRVAAGAF